MEVKHFPEEASQPRVIELKKVEVESPTVKSFVFEDPLCEKARPGQFVMIWIPGIDEIPMSVTHELGSARSMLLVKLVGDATRKLHAFRRGDKVCVRGPYGNYFTWNPREKTLLIAGGTGITPLLDILFTPKSRNIDFSYGVKERSELIFLEEIERQVQNPLIVTEDGDYGEKGRLSDAVEKLLEKRDYDKILCCGPELMIKRMCEIAEDRDIKLQASLERIMKCGVGICGSCAINGYLVCKDGPVFDMETLRHLWDLGVLTRNHSGRKIPVLK